MKRIICQSPNDCNFTWKQLRKRHMRRQNKKESAHTRHLRTCPVNTESPTGEMAFSSVSFLPAKWTHTHKFPCVVKKESIFFSVIQQKLTTWSVGETFIWCRTCQVIISSSRLGFVSIRDRVLNCVSVFVLASFSNSFGPGMFVWILFQIINIFKVVRLIDLDKEGNVFLIFCVCERLV